MSLSHYYIYFYVGKFSRGIGYLYPTKYITSAELPDEEYQTILMTGRILYYYTTRVMTGRTEELMKIAPSSFIEINIKNGDIVKVISRRGEIETTACVGYKVSKGESWMPFHFPDRNANWLTNAALYG